MLTQIQWEILNSMVDGSFAPFEIIAMDLRRNLYLVSKDQLLQHIFFLYQQGFVTITQAPIPVFGQTFEEKSICPESPEDILGDLKSGFDEFYAIGDYVQKESVAGSVPAGVPFGIYLELTETGRSEWDDERYRCYWPDDTE